jgi:hypothetical protein
LQLARSIHDDRRLRAFSRDADFGRAAPSVFFAA